MLQQSLLPIGVSMDYWLTGYYDNGATTLRSHVTERRLVQALDTGLWRPESELVWQRTAEVFASDHVEQELAAGAMKALARYAEAMRLGDFQRD